MISPGTYGKLSTWIWLLFPIISILTGLSVSGQSLPDTIVINAEKEVIIVADTVKPENMPQTDTLMNATNLVNDTIVITSLAGDTTLVMDENHTTIDAEIKRTAKDSILQNIKERKIYLYGEAVVSYKDITLKAEYIEVDMRTNTIYATGLPDTTGKIKGNPEFTQGGETFKSKAMTYNFNTQKGIITSVITEDDQGFLHGEKVKKLEDNTINILHGSYTTCNNEKHPHFRFRFKKARVMPNSKIITGPAYMEIEGMPTPLALPFGYFPNKTGKTSGIVIPTYGESNTRGFFLENGGYYWAINDYLDFQVLGDIYSRGSWGIKPRLRYKKRYRYSGDFNLGYAKNIVGTKDSPDYSNTKDFRIKWTHQQDPKARPNSTFTANVNIVSSNYVKYNVVSTQDYLSNEFQSSIAYQRNWNNTFFLTMNGSHRQNTKTHTVDITLPELTFSVNRFYPLRRESGGKKRFYEDLSVSYSTNARNTINTTDSTIFDKQMWDREMQWGAIHKIPISLPLKVMKYFTLSNSANFTDRMASQTIRIYDWTNDTLFDGNDTIVGYNPSDTVKGFRNAFDFNVSTSLSTKLFGMVKFKKGPVRAIRHVMTPNIGFSYTPDFSTEQYGYYDSYLDKNGNEIQYSQFTGTLFGSPPSSKSGSITFGLSNNLEMKVPSRKDTISGMKKIVLVESFNISGSYNLAADSLNMSMINMSGRTTLFKGLSLQYASQWDPYAADSAGRRYNQYEWNVNKRLLRLENTTWRLSFSYSLSDKTFSKDKGKKNDTGPSPGTEDAAIANELEDIANNPDDYVDWNIPWSLSINYNFTYSNNLAYINYVKIPEKTLVQTLGFSGQINITPKWKFTFSSGYDFTQKKMSLTNISLYRDLHCWEMRFNWIPTGARQSWNFSINVKASVLQDLKLNKKKDFRDI